MIVAVGVDLVDVARVRALLEKRREPFLERIYTEAERAYCLSSPRPAEHLAARFAAKEAVMKCLGTGHARGVGFRQVEVRRRTTGQVAVALTGQALEVSQDLRIRRIHLSLSHTEDRALAFAVAETGVPADL